MACASSHEPDEVPVLAGRVRITLYVSNELGVGLRCGIETKRGLYALVLEVSVYGLWTAYDAHRLVVGPEVLCKDCCVCVRVVTANDHDCIDGMLTAYLCAHSELLLSFKLRPSRSNDVESTGVPVLVYELVCHDHVFVFKDSARTAKETIELVLRVRLLQGIIETAYHVVSARSLSS